MATAPDPEPVHRPVLAIISGRPGSGKTTLAHALAGALGCPLISRDEINEGIHHTFHHDPALASKDRVAKQTYDAFFQILQMLVSAGVTCVAEAAFQDFRWRPGLEPVLPLADIRIVHCDVDAEVARARVLQRRRRKRGEPAGFRTGPFDPLSLAVPSIHVATADGYDPALDEIIAFLQPGRRA